jgi:signal transduction histidine kinase
VANITSAPENFVAFFSRWRWEFALAGAVLVTAAILATSELGQDRTKEMLEKIAQVGNESQITLHLIRWVTRTETAHHGYLLSQRDIYLRAYREGLNETKGMLVKLAQLYQMSNDAEGMQRIGVISTAVSERFANMEDVLQLARTQGMNQAMIVFNSDAGRLKMDEVRQEVAALLEYNRVRTETLREEAAAVFRFSRISVAAVTAVNIVLLVFVFRRLGEAWREKETEADALKAQQDWLDEQVRVRTALLEQLSVHLQDMLEAEKMRLARELHDELGAILTAAKMDVAWARSHLDANAPATREKLERTLKNLDQGIAVKRQIIENLRPSTLASFGLIVATRELVEESAKRNEWAVELDLPDAEPDIGQDTATALYRIMQESLNNAAKYAKAKRIRVRLVCTEHQLTAEVEDDGLGFRVRDIRPKALGIVGMRQRVEARGGRLAVFSSPGNGCRVQVILPLKPKEHCVAASESTPAAAVEPNIRAG